MVASAALRQRGARLAVLRGELREMPPRRVALEEREERQWRHCAQAVQCRGRYQGTLKSIKYYTPCNIKSTVLPWGVECTLADIGTGGPVKRSHVVKSTLLHFTALLLLLRFTGPPVPITARMH